MSGLDDREAFSVSGVSGGRAGGGHASFFLSLGVALLLCALGFLLGSSRAFAQVPPQSLDITVSVNIPFPNGNLDLSGLASPFAFVTVRIDGGVAGTTTADASSAWNKLITGLTPGTHDVEIYQHDVLGRQSGSYTFSIGIFAGSTTTVSNIFLPTTIALEATQIPRPASRLALGTTKQGSNVTLFVFSHGNDAQAHTAHSTSGNWSGNLNRTILHLGSHTAYAVAQDPSSGLMAPASQVLPFSVVLSADLNQDGRVELVDFSILMFSFERMPPPNRAADINDNGFADIVDFSVMLYYWTG